MFRRTVNRCIQKTIDSRWDMACALERSRRPPKPVTAEPDGLHVLALQQRPGVYSCRLGACSGLTIAGAASLWARRRTSATVAADAPEPVQRVLSSRSSSAHMSPRMVSV